jgi:transposase
MSRKGRIAVATFVGIDVSKERLDWALHGSDAAGLVAHDDEGLQELVRRLRELQPTLIVLEATGGLEMTVLAALSVAALPVAVVNPLQIRNFARATGKQAKTDRIDARCLAHFAAAVQPPLTSMPESSTIELELLLSRRRQLVTMLVAEKNRLSSLLGPRRVPRVVASIERLIKTLEKEIEKLDDELTNKIQASPVWKAKDKLASRRPAVQQKGSRP